MHFLIMKWKCGGSGGDRLNNNKQRHKLWSRKCSSVWSRCCWWSVHSVHSYYRVLQHLAERLSSSTVTQAWMNEPKWCCSTFLLHGYWSIHTALTTQHTACWEMQHYYWVTTLTKLNSVKSAWHYRWFQTISYKFITLDWNINDYQPDCH